MTQKDAGQKTQPKRTIRHTVSGGHSVDRAELLRSDRVRKVISEVAEKLKVTHPENTRPPGSQATS